MLITMKDNKNRRSRHFDLLLERLKPELTDTYTETRKACDYPEIRQFEFVDKEPETIFATAVISAHQVTVSLLDKGRAYTFVTPTRDPLMAIDAESPVSPELWERYMLLHSNISPVQEGYYWNWEGYELEASLQKMRWQELVNAIPDETLRSAGQDALDLAKKAVDEIRGVAPSLADVVSLNQKWKSKRFPLPEVVPVDDYLEWDKQYVRALLIIHHLRSYTA
ncbi:hypothetical protein Q9R34_19170 [Enterobacter sp. BRE11]|nr:hypothetical protein [Enterobacter sp. BRE11]